MDDLMNATRREAERVMAGVAKTQLGLVTSYDPATYAVKVTLMPEGVETGWLPYASLWVGNGWGLYAPPAIGDQVVVDPQEGEGETRLVRAALYSDEDRPLSVPSGEFWLVHRTGAKLRLLNTGEIDIRAASILAGPDGGAVRRLIDERFMALFNAHQHTGPDGITSPPTTPMTAAGHMTASLKGG
jgi:hypothetical protein